MTQTASYRTQAESLKSPRVAPFLVSTKNGGQSFDDIVAASLVAHLEHGTLYRVYRTKALWYERVEISPLPLEIARRCAKHAPKKPEPQLMCVPVWR